MDSAQIIDWWLATMAELHWRCWLAGGSDGESNLVGKIVGCIISLTTGERSRHGLHDGTKNACESWTENTWKCTELRVLWGNFQKKVNRIWR
jgi:hypothetical protein